MKFSSSRWTVAVAGLALTVLSLSGGSVAAKDGMSVVNSPIFCCSK